MDIAFKISILLFSLPHVYLIPRIALGENVGSYFNWGIVLVVINIILITISIYLGIYEKQYILIFSSGFILGGLAWIIGIIKDHIGF